jgi:hypothetical protein
MDEVKKPPAKKMKQGPVQLQMEQVPYLSQVRWMSELQVQNVVLQSTGKRDV